MSRCPIGIGAGSNEVRDAFSIGVSSNVNRCAIKNDCGCLCAIGRERDHEGFQRTGIHTISDLRNLRGSIKGARTDHIGIVGVGDISHIFRREDDGI